jgi:sec-independent protein translocase protein TatA
MFSQIGPLEIILVLGIALLVLGPKRLPEAGRSVGRGIRNFKGAISGDHDDDEDERPELAKATAEKHPAEEHPAEERQVTEALRRSRD